MSAQTTRALVTLGKDPSWQWYVCTSQEAEDWQVCAVVDCVPGARHFTLIALDDMRQASWMLFSEVVTNYYKETPSQNDCQSLPVQIIWNMTNWLHRCYVITPDQVILNTCTFVHVPRVSWWSPRHNYLLYFILNIKQWSYKIKLTKGIKILKGESLSNGGKVIPRSFSDEGKMIRILFWWGIQIWYDTGCSRGDKHKQTNPGYFFKIFFEMALCYNLFSWVLFNCFAKKNNGSYNVKLKYIQKSFCAWDAGCACRLITA